MRDLIVFGIVVLSLPMAFQRPFFGLLMFSWLAYMRPQDLCWGFARSMRLSFFLGITMVAGWLAFESGQRRFYRSSGRAKLLGVLAILVTLSLVFGYKFDKYIQRYYIEFLKIIAVALFTMGQVDTKQRLRIILWTIAISLGFYGFKSGLLGILAGGAVIKQGPGGMLGDNNDFALAMVMNMPLLFYLGRDEKRVLVRRLCDICFVFSAVTVILTHSRGGFLSMSVVIFMLAWRSGKLFIAGALVIVAVVAFFLFAPDHVIDRLASIKQGTDEGSAGARWKSWTVALRMIQANPILGVGLRNFQIGYQNYGQDILAFTGGKTHVAHNSYLQIWAEAGTLALLVYMTLLYSVFQAAGKVRRHAKNRPGFEWAFSYARAFEVTLIGFMIGAFFLNRGHFDLTYHWIGLSGCLYWIYLRELKVAEVAAAAGEDGSVPTETAPVPKGPVGPSFRPADGGRPIPVSASGAPIAVWSRRR